MVTARNQVVTWVQRSAVTRAAPGTSPVDRPGASRTFSVTLYQPNDDMPCTAIRTAVVDVSPETRRLRLPPAAASPVTSKDTPDDVAYQLLSMVPCSKSQESTTPSGPGGGGVVGSRQ